MIGLTSQLWNHKFRMAGLVVLLFVGLVSHTSAEVQLTGAGATFPSALYMRWFKQYATVDGVHIQYRAIGSGGGMKGLMEQSIAFGASDAPMTDEQMQAAKGGTILHVPTVMGAVAVIYSLPKGARGLRLTPKTIEGLFLGTITRWNDPQLTKLNPGLPLPDQTITLVHRSDGSGTTQVLTDYLSKVSLEWKKRVGQGTAVIWPVGIAAKRNEGVAELVKRTPGAVSYAELSQALQSGIPYALVQNRAGNFIEPTLASVSAAATKTMLGTADDFRMSLTDAPVPDAYPISAFTWFLVYKNQSNKDQGEKLVNFLWWMMHEGQKEAPALHHAPLPKEVVVRGEQTLTEITYEGQPLLTKK